MAFRAASRAVAPCITTVPPGRPDLSAVLNQCGVRAVLARRHSYLRNPSPEKSSVACSHGTKTDFAHWHTD